MTLIRTFAAGVGAALALGTAAAAPQEKGAGQPPAEKPIPAAPPAAKPALTREQIQKMLQPVPFFTVTDEKGAPMIATPKDKQKGAVGFFGTPAAAEAFLANLRTRNPAVAANVRVSPVSLWDIFRIATDPKSPFLVAFVADEAETLAAKPLLKAGQKVNVPLFVGRSLKSGGLLTVSQGERQVIPAFLSKKDLDDLMARFQKSQSAIMQDVKVEVLDLEGLLGSLGSATDPNIVKVAVMASRANLEYLQKQSPAKKSPIPTAPLKPTAGRKKP